MNKKKFLLGLALLVSVQLFAAEEMQFAMRSSNVVSDYQSLANKQKIVFENDAMTVHLKSGETIANIHSVIFRLGETSNINTPTLKSSVIVFPNPATTTITVSSAAETTTINLFNLNSTLIKSVVTTTENTDINVSSLKQGMYLLQVGEQVIKFIKK